ncbi:MULTISPECIES: hypothetical protein [Clostridium]|uniref:Prenylated flavin chaperone LpdD-like domain-containing protein n=3 Tax=Clostridium TaxID=1485 RepID=A0AAV3W765_9CLOT|nr:MULTISPECIES: hypothetical protein [Clostridium]NRY63232.1 hypothetical protein [Clostridium beijerinckii]OOM58691.1 hypothetical protein CLBCK_38660 [Clostridium beijerinckii]QES73424.1 hypothetical protein F3K33_11555 [Clostridium diolis]GEA32809.1 hypothetical protein CDIOL_37320 [Clostridium diolis]
MKEISLNVGEGKYQVFLHALFCGKDVSICIFGGDVPHIGAVAVAVPRKSLTGDGSNSASASVICITGHKEDEMARNIALKFSSKFMCNITVSAGVHIDDAKKKDIEVLGRNIKKIIKSFEDKISESLNEH